MVKRKYAPSNNYKDMELELPTTHKWKPGTQTATVIPPPPYWCVCLFIH
jgi:hypothetical protein